VSDRQLADGGQGTLDEPRRRDATRDLYSAILREIQVKGKEARFKKTERGHFAANG
jgi:hypothetical protein